MRLFLDANVLFTAAHNSGGKAAFIIELSQEGYWEALTCELALEEARRNLESKFPKALTALNKLLPILTTTPTTAIGKCPFPLAEKDQPIFLSAKQAKATHLLTGDLKDFGKYMNQPKKTGGIMIQTVAEFLKNL